uniref:ZF-HD dimerization-type domain-containing protein n=1 Tax=Physcomitrium patens TaxID=3218 RepID=A0A2K1JE35_PHYPA|nr:hypothetical protein PHYPA_020077 [Physcomitrium patens]
MTTIHHLIHRPTPLRFQSLLSLPFLPCTTALLQGSPITKPTSPLSPSTYSSPPLRPPHPPKPTNLNTPPTPAPHNNHAHLQHQLHNHSAQPLLIQTSQPSEPCTSPPCHAIPPHPRSAHTAPLSPPALCLQSPHAPSNLLRSSHSSVLIRNTPITVTTSPPPDPPSCISAPVRHHSTPDTTPYHYHFTTLRAYPQCTQTAPRSHHTTPPILAHSHTASSPTAATSHLRASSSRIFASNSLLGGYCGKLDGSFDFFQYSSDGEPHNLKILCSCSTCHHTPMPQPTPLQHAPHIPHTPPPSLTTHSPRLPALPPTRPLATHSPHRSPLCTPMQRPRLLHSHTPTTTSPHNTLLRTYRHLMHRSIFIYPPKPPPPDYAAYRPSTVSVNAATKHFPTSVRPGMMGFPASSSASMHPVLQRSTATPYSVAPSSSSGGRYHNVTTRLVRGCF